MYKKFIRPILFLINPEKTHDIIFFFIKIFFKIPLVKFFVYKIYSNEDERLNIELFDLIIFAPFGPLVTTAISTIELIFSCACPFKRASIS